MLSSKVNREKLKEKNDEGDFSALKRLNKMNVILKVILFIHTEQSTADDLRCAVLSYLQNEKCLRIYVIQTSDTDQMFYLFFSVPPLITNER